MLNYGEIKDTAKMTDSRMALFRRGLGSGKASANAQRQASNEAVRGASHVRRRQQQQWRSIVAAHLATRR